MQVTTFSVDLAKNKFQVHGFSAVGEKIVAKTLPRAKFLAFLSARSERCRVVMEACAASHHWARALRSLGFHPELLPAQHVAALVAGEKNDANDADAIYEAANRPKIRRVAIKSESQQDLLALHRVRDRLVRSRTALINQIRGLLAERGVVFAPRTGTLKQALPRWLDGAGGPFAILIESLLEAWRSLDQRINHLEGELKAHYRASPACQRIGAVEGIGVIGATAITASVGDARAFHSGRQFAAWMGLTPRERSSGERRYLGSITKRGDGYSASAPHSWGALGRARRTQEGGCAQPLDQRVNNAPGHEQGGRGACEQERAHPLCAALAGRRLSRAGGRLMARFRRLNTEPNRR